MPGREGSTRVGAVLRLTHVAHVLHRFWALSFLRARRGAERLGTSERASLRSCAHLSEALHGPELIPTTPHAWVAIGLSTRGVRARRACPFERPAQPIRTRLSTRETTSNVPTRAMINAQIEFLGKIKCTPWKSCHSDTRPARAHPTRLRSDTIGTTCERADGRARRVVGAA